MAKCQQLVAFENETDWIQQTVVAFPGTSPLFYTVFLRMSSRMTLLSLTYFLTKKYYSESIECSSFHKWAHGKKKKKKVFTDRDTFTQVLWAAKHYLIKPHIYSTV